MHLFYLILKDIKSLKHSLRFLTFICNKSHQFATNLVKFTGVGKAGGGKAVSKTHQ